MYRKIYREDFKWPPWFSSEARRLVTKPIDPNPSTRITISKVMDSSWFKKSIPKVVLTKQEQELDEPSDKITAKQTETLNVFHIISLSEGMNGSPSFSTEEQQQWHDHQRQQQRLQQQQPGGLLPFHKPPPLPMFHCNGWTLTWGVAARGGTNFCLCNTTAYDIYRNTTFLKGCTSPQQLRIHQAPLCPSSTTAPGLPRARRYDHHDSKELQRPPSND
ncbi:hypothetical protein FF1_008192 [Malus domestica]